MGLTPAEEQELAELEKIQKSVDSGKSSLSGRIRSGNSSVERKIKERGTESFGEAARAIGEADGGFKKTMATLNLAIMPLARFEAGIANASMALQDGKADKVLDEFVLGARGKKLGEIGDVYRKAGAPEWAAATIGLTTTMLPIVGATLKGTTQLTKSLGLTKHTDKFVKSAGKQLLNSADEAVSHVGKAVDSAYAPVNNIIVDSVDTVKAFEKSPKLLTTTVEEVLGKSLDDIAESGATIADVRKMTQTVGKVKNKVFGAAERGLEQSREVDNINTTYSSLKQLVKKTLDDRGLQEHSKALLNADEAFAETKAASNFIRNAIVHPKLKKPTRVGTIARGITKAGDTSTREAVNVLLKGGEDSSKAMMKAISALNKYNRTIAASKVFGKVLNYMVLGGVAGSIGARSAQRSFGGDSGDTGGN